MRYLVSKEAHCIQILHVTLKHEVFGGQLKM